MYELNTRIRKTYGLPVAAMLGFGTAFTPATQAHDWYPYSCCSDRDCHPVPPEAVQFTPTGWRVRTTGETIPFDKTRFSPDGRYHICSRGGKPDGKTICLFTPGSGS